MTGSWGLLRPSWSLLGRSWRPLGASLGALGGVLVSPNLPLRPRNVVTQFSSILFFHPFSHLKFTQLTTTQLNSCALTFCPFAASILEPFGLQNRAKIDPSRVKSPLDTSFFQKLEFSRNIGRRSVWSVSRVPRQHPKRTKIDPRQLEDDLRNLFFRLRFCLRF